MEQPKIIQLIKISDPRGNLSVIEEIKDIELLESLFDYEEDYYVRELIGKRIDELKLGNN